MTGFQFACAQPVISRCTDHSSCNCCRALRRAYCSYSPAPRLRSFRGAHHIPGFDPAKPRDWLTLREAAKQLQVSVMTVRQLITSGVLPAWRIVPHAPWMIDRDTLQQEAVQHAVRAAQQGGRCPLPGHPGQLTLVP
jgi:excisionase family DNA binding protein